MAEVFTNDPINWLKQAVVFGVLIGSFIVSMKMIKKIGYVLQGQKKQMMPGRKVMLSQMQSLLNQEKNMKI